MPEPAPSDPADAEEIKPIIAMVHVGALPGTPQHRLSLVEIVDAAVAEARLYKECGVNSLIIENMHDVPYLRGGVGPEIVAAMTLIAQAVKAETDLPIGLQILAGADIEAMAVAHAAGLDFIRAECYSFAHVADEGMMESNAAKLLRYRRMIGAEEVEVWADIKKKHASHALTADLSLGDVAEAAEFMGAQTLIVTGTSTGRPPLPSDVEEARNRCQLPVFVGSGVDAENVAALLEASDGLIIGSYFKRGGHWANEIDADRVRRFVEIVARLNAVAPPPSAPTKPSLPPEPPPVTLTKQPPAIPDLPRKPPEGRKAPSSTPSSLSLPKPPQPRQ